MFRILLYREFWSNKLVYRPIRAVNINNTRLQYYMACYITWGSSGRECIIYKKKWMGNPIGTCSLLKRKLVALK